MVTREAELLARTLAREFKIVAIIGPRQSGKTPLAQAGVGGGDEPLHLLRAPVRRSGTALVTKHLETGVPMALHMPRTPTNLRRALHHDWQWWSDLGDEMTERFGVWLAR